VVLADRLVVVSVFWFGETLQFRDEAFTELTQVGALLEWSSRSLLAIAETDLQHAQVVADFLQTREDLGALTYETGRSH
jgi:hypothetical protein